jgi:hypothetical protein
MACKIMTILASPFVFFYDENPNGTILHGCIMVTQRHYQVKCVHRYGRWFMKVDRGDICTMLACLKIYSKGF